MACIATRQTLAICPTLLGLLAPLGCSGAYIDGTGGTSGIAVNACEGLEGAYEIQGASMVLLRTETGCAATVTPRYWPSAHFEATIEPEQLVLEAIDRGAISGRYWNPPGHDEWEYTRFVVPRDAAGRLTGPVRAQGENRYCSGDVWGSYPVDEADWTFELDHEPPMLQVTRRWPVGPSDSGYAAGQPAEQWYGLPSALLPWDTVQVEASERVPGLSAALTAASQAAAGPGISSWSDGEMSGVGPADDVWAWGRLDDWLAVHGSTAELMLGSGLTDVAGHPLAAVAISMDVLDVGPPASSHELDDIAAIGSWGDVQTVVGELGVARLQSICWEDGYVGIAALVDASGAQQVSVRLRGLAATYAVRVVGQSGQEYGRVGGAHDQTWQVESYAIGPEQLVGVSVVVWTNCDFHEQAVLDVDYIRAE